MCLNKLQQSLRICLSVRGRLEIQKPLRSRGISSSTQEILFPPFNTWKDSVTSS
ncbi:hypothetical protein I79_003635 [Cricetulus griseus]|uniref:Uncharacterized protein n=1 Tax=Cricetulus griseus TaxID=10029 RepID=G3H0H8_CRIGR|nr:hypothetical protein I79_003635 [Cricetulus griseus]